MPQPTAYRQGANAFILDQESRLLLVQLVDYGPDEWGVPGGGSEGDEDVLATAYREVNEEVGIEARQLTVVGIAKKLLIYDFPESMRTSGVAVAQQFKGQQKHQVVFSYDGPAKLTFDPKEVRDYRWARREHLAQYLLFPDQHANAEAVLSEFMTSASSSN